MTSLAQRPAYLRGMRALASELRGNLAAMLGAAVQSERSPAAKDLVRQVPMAAEACNWLCHLSCTTAGLLDYGVHFSDAC